MSFFILIKDIVNNKEYIYNKKVITKDNLAHVFQHYYDNLNNDGLLLQIHDTYAEIYKNTNVINKGWVWNSVEQQREVIYLLNAIELHEKFFNPLPTLTITTQTSVFDTTDYTDYRELNSNDSDSDEYISQEPFSDSSDEGDAQIDYRQNECQKIYDIWNTECIYDQYCEPETTTKDIQFVVGNGYANTLFFPWQELSIELKQKLNTPNFGLKQTTYNMQ